MHQKAYRERSTRSAGLAHQQTLLNRRMFFGFYSKNRAIHICRYAVKIILVYLGITVNGQVLLTNKHNRTEKITSLKFLDIDSHTHTHTSVATLSKYFWYAFASHSVIEISFSRCLCVDKMSQSLCDTFEKQNEISLSRLVKYF